MLLFYSQSRVLRNLIWAWRSLGRFTRGPKNNKLKKLRNLIKTPQGKEKGGGNMATIWKIKQTTKRSFFK